MRTFSHGLNNPLLFIGQLFVVIKITAVVQQMHPQQTMASINTTVPAHRANVFMHQHLHLCYVCAPRHVYMQKRPALEIHVFTCTREAAQFARRRRQRVARNKGPKSFETSRIGAYV